MRTVHVTVRDGDSLAGSVRTLKGAIACVRQASADLTDAEAQFIAGVAWGRQIDTRVESLARVIGEVLGPDVAIERS